MNIVCIGEALIDFKATGALAFQGYVGGSPLNVAVAASRLGGEVGFAAQVSTDMFGDDIVAFMHENGVDTAFVERSDAPSTLAFVSEIGGDAHFSFMANGAADTLYDPRPRPVFPEPSYLQFGSISLLADPTATAITETVAAHKGRTTIVFDPNVRPALISDRGTYLEKLERWLALADIVKISAQDLSWLAPGMDVEELVSGWLERGPQAVIVTRGAEGASLLRQGRPIVTVPAPCVAVVDTVGAGDTFTGALMVALLERGGGSMTGLSDEDAREVLRFAAAAAALNCRRAGADPPNRPELASYLERNDCREGRG
ncbi:MAG: carbohydrate kinase [Trueperaceae bacterium]|nr:MAG: carbohydrate kinase [Trueperaceae bacterium]